MKAPASEVLLVSTALALRTDAELEQDPCRDFDKKTDSRLNIGA